MAKRKESDLKERLERYRQIKLTVVGRKTGQTDLKSGLVCVRRRKALPASGARSDTQWYRNMLKNPSIRVDAR